MDERVSECVTNNNSALYDLRPIPHVIYILNRHDTGNAWVPNLFALTVNL